MLSVFEKLFGWNAISVEKEDRLRSAWAAVDQLTIELQIKNAKHLDKLKNKVQDAQQQGLAVLEESLGEYDEDSNASREP
jgi:hypothetical protein